MASSPLMLPSGCADLLNELGFVWPKSDEVKIVELGGDWNNFGGELQNIQGQGAPVTENISAQNQGLDIDAFKQAFTDSERGSEVLKDGGTGSMVTGSGLFIGAGLVLGLKITVIVQLTILVVQIAQAIAAAPGTFGASLAWIPVAKKLTQMMINLAISQVLEALMA